jgi:hypothetical protein
MDYDVISFAVRSTEKVDEATREFSTRGWDLASMETMYPTIFESDDDPVDWQEYLQHPRGYRLTFRKLKGEWR